jgi:abortive infection bacteriophage resistance protein
MSDKVFKSHDQQLIILRARGLMVDSNSKRILETENYYNVVNGYKDLFLDQSCEEETYKSGTDFQEIFALYEFDREIRFIFLKRLLKIENHVKSVIAYKFSEKYTHDNYLKLSNFESYKNNDELQAIMDVISTFQRTISDRCSKHDAIKHYVTTYGYVPLWVLVNVLTFGSISKFFGLLKLQDRQSISKEFSIQENVFKGYLKLMSLFRNVCAHEERLYSKKFKQEIAVSSIHSRLAIPNVNGKYSCGTTDLFALLICIHELLPKDDISEFTDIILQINKELENLQNKIHTINENDILISMGFPVNWKTL